MKTLKKMTFFIALIALFASCQSNSDVNKILANQATKEAIMKTIANDSNLSVEMMEAMMNSENSNMVMQNQGTMLKMMQNNPAMMQSMMNGMMETVKGDTAMMSSMCYTILNNPQMMDMIHKKMGTQGMNHMEGMNHNMNMTPIK